jgi:hypothetical protein
MRLTEKEVLEKLKAEPNKYRPLCITRIETGVDVGEGLCSDAIAELSVSDGPSFQAIMEIKSLSTPKAIRAASIALNEMLRTTMSSNMVSLFVAPYIGSKQADLLKKEGLSWIDLCGNMVIRVPGRLYIERTGNPNMYPDRTPIRKIFQGRSSLVSRALLLKPEGFSSLYEIADFINSRNATITVPTVSKVLKVLNNELLIKKEKSLVAATEPEQILERLAEGYANYTSRREKKECGFAIDNERELFPAFFQNQIEYAAYGFYAAMLKGLATTDKVTVFVKSIDDVKRTFEYLKPDAEFGQLMLTETRDPCAWFNVQKKPLECVVDDIELYLEMRAATPRGPKIAVQLKESILKRD